MAFYLCVKSILLHALVLCIFIMAGHSRWANIKHKKGAADARRSKLFTKLIKEIMVAAKVGGANPDANPRLRLAIQNARGVSVPKENIERALSKASGNDGTQYQDVVYEGYGPSRVAIYVECTTDNLNRTIGNIRSYFSKAGGSLAPHGTHEFIFEQQGVFEFKTPGNTDTDELILELIDGGASEVETDEEMAVAYCSREDFGTLQKKIESLGIEPESSGLQMIPRVWKNIGEEDARKVARLIEALENDDDVKTVYHNTELTDEIMTYFQ